MPRYFHGLTIGDVAGLPATAFPTLCHELENTPARIKLTRIAFHALPKKEQGKAKMVRYLTPCVFKTDPSHRSYEHMGDVANLVCVDVDDAKEAAHVERTAPKTLGDLGFVIWRTASSTPEKPRLRVVVNADGIPVGRYRAAAQTIAAMLGVTANTESMVAVQPMYWPTIFVGETNSPVVHNQPDGDAFLPIDIVDTEGAQVIATTGVLGDLEYLRTPMDGISAADAGSALAVLSPDVDMKKWVEVAMGLKHQFGDAEGFELWDAWSAKGAKYDGREALEKRWATFKANTPNRVPVTIRTVFRYAQEAGWKNEAVVRKALTELEQWIKSEQRSSEELLDQAPVRIAKASALLTPLQRKSTLGMLQEILHRKGSKVSVPDLRKEVHRVEVEESRQKIAPWTKTMCFCTGPNFFYQFTTDRRYKPEVLDLIYGTEPSEEKTLRPRDYAIQIAEMQKVENLRYDPRHPDKRFFVEDGQPFVNTYRPSYVAADADGLAAAAKVIHQHLGNLVREPAYRQVLLNFIAYLVQFPGHKIRWTPLIQSGEGAGKTWLADLCAAILGTRNVTKLAGNLVLEDKQNGWAYGAQLVAIEEIRVVGHNRHAVMDKLKPLISDDRFSLREFREGPRTVPNITNYVMFTNFQDSLAVTENSRRYFVVVSPLQSELDIRNLGGEAYFNEIYGALAENPGGFRAFFEQWKISSDFNPNGRAPITPYLHDLAENAASPLTAAVRQAVEDKNHALVRPDLLSTKALREQIGVMPGILEYSDQTLGSVLRELGWSKAGRCMKDGDRHNLWTHGSKIKDPVHTALLRLEFL